MSNICCITKKKSVIGNKRSNSMHSTKRKFFSNIHKKKFWIENKNKYIKLNISSKGIRIIKKKGIEYVLSFLKIKY